MTDAEERELRIEIMRADLDLKRKQGFWETPKALAIIVATAVALSGAVFGTLGYKIGSQPPAPPMFPPGTVITIPPAKP